MGKITNKGGIDVRFISQWLLFFVGLMIGVLFIEFFFKFQSFQYLGIGKILSTYAIGMFIWSFFITSFVMFVQKRAKTVQ